MGWVGMNITRIVVILIVIVISSFIVETILHIGTISLVGILLTLLPAFLLNKFYFDKEEKKAKKK